MYIQLHFVQNKIIYLQSYFRHFQYPDYCYKMLASSPASEVLRWQEIEVYIAKIFKCLSIIHTSELHHTRRGIFIIGTSLVHTQPANGLTKVYISVPCFRLLYLMFSH